MMCVLVGRSILASVSVVVMVMLQPASTLAAPTPSPGLGGLLAAPPAGYAAVTSGSFHGRFTASDYVASYRETAQAALGVLQRDGFVGGYGLTWVQRTTGRSLLEFVIALTGENGAKDWLAYEKASDLSHPEFKHADTLAGIGPYYGEHLVSSSPAYFADVFSFVKGNDMFGVGFISPNDDVATLAATQVKLQYDSAPDATIPPAQWPENAASPQTASTFDLGGTIKTVLILTVILIAIFCVAAGVVLFVRRTRPLAPAPVASGPTLNQMSPDGNQWWDGQRWVESSVDPPPFAQRTEDGAFWWDGFSWRPVPNGAQSPPSGR
jgi:hypothetical protein